jgi:hypothetical protein
MSRSSWYTDPRADIREHVAVATPVDDWRYGSGTLGHLVCTDGLEIPPGMYESITIPEDVTATVPWADQNVPVFQVRDHFSIYGTLDLRGRDAVGRLGVFRDLPSAIDPAEMDTTGESSPSPADAGNVVPRNSGPFLGGAPGTTDAAPFFPPVEPNLSVLNLIRLLHWGPAGISYGVRHYGMGGIGAGDDEFYGGAGGGPGKIFLLMARRIIHGPNNMYMLQGGKGGDGGDDGEGNLGNGNCSGGGGGAGGWWMTMSKEIVGVAGECGTGGEGGAGCGGGEDGQPGMTGRGIHYLDS